MGRCIPIVEGEGKPHNQCVSLWENKNRKGVNSMEPIKKIFESEIKSFDDKTLTIEHFISTEQEDRSKDIVRADGMFMDGTPVVLKQHGFDPDTGHEPIAKPLSIAVGTNEKGVKGIIVKTQYYDGSGLTPPDNTGQRLYQKAKERFMPYWSIGFSSDDAVPRPGGGTEFKKWRLNEYSQVGIPDNIGAEVVKTMEPIEVEEKANEIFTYEIQKPKSIKEYRAEFIKILAKDGEKATMTMEDIEELGIVLSNDEKIAFVKKWTSLITLKSIADRVAQDLPWEAMRTLWFGALDELYYSDGSEKAVKAILKELVELMMPHALAFAQNTGNAGEAIEIKNLTYIDLTKEKPVEPAPDPPVNRNLSPVVIKLKPEPKPLKLPEGFKDILREAMKDEFKTALDQMKGKVNV